MFLFKEVSEIKEDLEGIEMVKLGAKPDDATVDSKLKNVPKLTAMLATTSDIFTPPEKIYGKDILMYIYTSGTTGLPKVGFSS